MSNQNFALGFGLRSVLASDLLGVSPPGSARTPAFWLATGACLLVLLASAKRPRCPARCEAALALVMSGLLYTCAYLIIGVATDLRYQFWSMVATFTALVISSSGLRVPFASSPARSGSSPSTCEPNEHAKP